MAAAVREIIECSAASLPLHGQAKAGGRFLVKLLGRQALVAVVDGVAHGDEAVAPCPCSALHNILDRFALESDDALVRVVQYVYECSSSACL